MYSIKDVEIHGFWTSKYVKCNFHKDINLIIGKNGSGKTTFINLLIGVLTGDIESISEFDFSKIIINLSKKGSSKKIEVNKNFSNSNVLQDIEFKIEDKVFTFVFSTSFRRVRGELVGFQKGSIDEIDKLNIELESLVDISSLSVYRLRKEDDYEVLQRGKREIISPVDFKLKDMMNRLIRYQLEITQKANKISQELKNEVLVSILYDGSRIPRKNDFNAEEEKEKLLKSYKQLNINSKTTELKIEKHINNLEKVFKDMNSIKDNSNADEVMGKFFASVESLRKTQAVFEMSIKAEEKRDRIFEPLNIFIDLLKEFIDDKCFEVNQDGLNIKNFDNKKVGVEKLSSGEKQLIILLCEALLQKNSNSVYITDEPELSLHIAWQRKVIPSVRKLNPNSQIIVATHSPEIAGYDKEKIISMRSLFNG